jgi:hypothetical protein
MDKPIKVIFDKNVKIVSENDIHSIQMTVASINYEVPDKEYILQITKRGFRCISWYPHYIMTEWVRNKEQAIKDGDKAIKKYYQNGHIVIK